jgi:hypothetical protein
MKKIIIAIALSVGLAGCAQFQSFEAKVQTAYDALNSAQINYNYATAGVQSFEGLQKVGAAYLRLPTCTASGGPVCHDRRATAPIRAAFIAGRQARNDVLAYMDTHPCADTCPLMPQGVYAGLKSAVDELNNLYSTYKVNLTGAQ